MLTPRVMVKTLIGRHPLWCMALYYNHKLTIPSCCAASWITQFYLIQYQIFKYILRKTINKREVTYTSWDAQKCFR